jgi:hypothetical protein
MAVFVSIRRLAASSLPVSNDCIAALRHIRMILAVADRCGSSVSAGLAGCFESAVVVVAIIVGKKNRSIVLYR